METIFEIPLKFMSLIYLDKYCLFVLLEEALIKSDPLVYILLENPKKIKSTNVAAYCLSTGKEIWLCDNTKVVEIKITELKIASI